MKLKLIFVLFLVCKLSTAQNIKAFYYVEPETKNLPVFIRGNLSNKTILLYIQGGDAENGIDFGRSDYPKWKSTLEKHTAIAYFDQRGLNRSVKKIDTSKINKKQNLKDIISIAKSLSETYNAKIYLFGHSNGGRYVLETLGTYSKECSFITGGIAFNTTITTDFSKKRYKHYRPLYLKNLAKEHIAKSKDRVYWQEAYDWMSERDSIHTREDSKQWNNYVDSAFKSETRKIGLGMILNTVFARPYNPIKYLNYKDNKFVGDKLWYADKKLWDTNKQVPLWDILPKIKHPILLITGRYDAISVPEEVKDAHKLISNSEIEIIPNAAHESFLDQPTIFKELIINYLK